jgi:hypothetical protein
MIETLSMLRGKDIKITDNITIHQPTLGEIEEYDEFAYMSMVSTFVCTPFDMIAQLDKEGYDFTKVTSFQLFCLLCRQLKQSETRILFGGLDFSSLRAVTNERNQIELRNKNVVITEKVYQDISDSVRAINSIPPPMFKGVADEHTKQKMIEYAYDELEFAKRRKPKSGLRTMVSRATNHPYFKYRLDEVWDMTVYSFYDAIKSIGIVEGTYQLNMGIYCGNVDMKKINKNNCNWLREAKD